ncbi:hypothetical protein IM543_07695 [Massilia sp. UMI-21]|nr:hypothetical protein IM543_07695 [Massilia sp. UMI-21]
MMRLSNCVLPLLVVAGLSACQPRQPGTQQAAAAPPGAMQAATGPAAAAPAAPAVHEIHAAPAAPPPGAAGNAAAPGKAFDLQSIPVTSAALPPFPYVAMPSELGPKQIYTEKDIEFDRVYVIAGEDMRPAEGKVLQRKFFLHTLKWSPLAAHRNYETALSALGARRVDAIHPFDERFVDRNGGDSAAIWKKMQIPHLDRMEDPDVPGFEQWLLRTPDTHVWISFFLANGQVHVLTVEEKAMRQLVQTLPATALSTGR